MLLWIIRMDHDGGAIFVGEPALNILPQIVESHEHVVFKLFAVNAHLLSLDLFLARGPDVWLCQELQRVE